MFGSQVVNRHFLSSSSVFFVVVVGFDGSF